ncbi:MAG TPA: flavodoxin-dependent (E)-4-hydroxy-3-methylbut-2-enyl-diphosphate synthase, partial [Candidatus Omnitrophota bacterium]|nr:flavodoxin-dependent (E)-4-hydroxy-3-methylbut-2-enyl-diphosphate synthase [Candidatus Omnitrophota bacterium]
QDLAKRCSYVLHLGLTEAGSGARGITTSVSALAILLQQGIGDTLRVSLTPQPGHPRWEEVLYCKELLQALGSRYFTPTVISCPGCGRTANQYFEQLAQRTKNYIDKRQSAWQAKNKKINQLKIAVMGCIVNGPGESKHADIGLSLPGQGETDQAAVYIDGKLATTLHGKTLEQQFFRIIENYIRSRY